MSCNDSVCCMCRLGRPSVRFPASLLCYLMWSPSPPQTTVSNKRLSLTAAQISCVVCNHTLVVKSSSVGIEMQYQYRYQTLIWLCISIDIEISFHAVKSVILHHLILQLSKIILLTYKIYKTEHEFN